MKKRWISMLLCICMVVSLFPTAAFASEEAEAAEEIIQEVVEEISQDVVEETVQVEAVVEEIVCTCGTDDAAFHAVTCGAYTAPAEPVCFCAEKCAEPNEWCDICGFDYEACGGTDTAVTYEEETATVGGTSDDGLTWTYDETNGVLTISGTGVMMDYTGSNTPWDDYLPKITALVVEDGITAIGAYAFYDSSKLSDVTIPEGVTVIGEHAFYGCEKITDFHFPEELEVVGEDAFANCDGLVSVDLPEGVTSIGKQAFYNCDNLTSVSLPGSLAFIGGSAFTDCSKLEQIAIPEGITSIERRMFDGCSSLSSVTLPSGLQSIGTQAFVGCTSLAAIDIPDSVTVIDNYAFQDCASLTEIVIPDGVTTISTGMLNKCTGITDLVLHGDIAEIGQYAFKYSGIQTIHYLGDQSAWNRITINTSTGTLGEAEIHCCSYEAAVEPTCSENGSEEAWVCSQCGVIRGGEEIPALDHNFEAGVCIQCGVNEWDTDGDGALEILAIGNSFSVDALEYAYQIAESLGIENIVLGNLYKGSCTLETHAKNAKNNTAAYAWFYNDNGTWSQDTNTWKDATEKTMGDALQERTWDFVSLQQASGSSGQPDTYNADLDYLIQYVSDNAPGAKLVWHMTWAYQQNTTHSAFPTYGKDQMTMYNAIVSAVQSKIATNGNFDLIVPNGTAVQNSRTSLLGDTTTIDGYHMSRPYGRYLTSLMFIKAITGMDISDVTYAPSGVDAEEKAIAMESVNHASANPFAVTQSAYVEVEPEIPDEGYILLKPELHKGAYWNATDKTRYNVLIADADNSKYFFATDRFTKEDLPVGSVIVLESGWQYRADGWITDAVQSSRANTTTESYVVVTEAWWGNYSLRGFNISKVGTPSVMDLSAEDVHKVFRIYVPEEKHTHDYTTVVTAPTCTEQGYTTYTCTLCGDSYVADLLDATGEHTYKNGICTGCGKEDTDGLDLNGLNVLCLGDSITAGQGLTTETRWTNVLASKYDWNLTNKSQGGISLSSYYYTANGKSNVSIAKKAEILKTMTTKPDVIIVWGGHNDTGYRYSPLGTWDDETTDSFKGALKYIAELADEYAPDATLFVLTPLWTTEAPSTLKVPENTTDNNWMFVDAIYDGAEAYGWIPINMDLCGITPFTISGLTLDSVHPNAAGTEKIVEYLSAELASYGENSQKETILFNKSAVSMKPGESTTLKAVLSPRSGTGTMTFTWSSSDSSVATVDANGKIIAVAPGNAIITATTTNGTSAGISVSVVCEHDYEAAVTDPTCTEQGYTTYTCECGDSYVSDYVDAVGHTYKNGTCTGCGEAQPGPVITQQSESVQQEIGKKFAITVKAEGEGLTYQWYVKESGAKAFKVSSNKTASYAYTMQSYMHNRQVYCVITDANGNSVQTETATITRPPQTLKILQQPQDAQQEIGQKFSIKPTVQGDGLTYQWCYKESYMKDFAVSSNKTSAYAYTMQSYMHNRSVYCVITDQYGNSVTTDAATITRPPVELKILQQPADVYAAKEEKFSIKPEVQGDGLTYQWYYKESYMKDFKPSSNKTSAYAYSMQSYMNNRSVYCVITDKFGNQVQTEAVTIYLEK